FQGVGWNTALATIHSDMTVGHHLACGRARIGETEMKNNIVQPCLKDLEHGFTGDTAFAERTLINPPKLALLKAVVTTQLLFLDQAQRIIGIFAARLRTMHARWIIFPLEV